MEQNKSLKQLEFKENVSIHDACIEDIKMYKQDCVLCIDIVFELSYPRNSKFKIAFKNIIEFFFYWENDCDFYTITEYKFFKLEDNTYCCSLDPDEMTSGMSEKDYFMIKSKEIKTTLL